MRYFPYNFTETRPQKRQEHTIAKIEGTALHGNEQSQHAVERTNHTARNVAHQLLCKTSEPLAASPSEFTTPTQPQAHSQDEEDLITAITRPGSTASKEARAERRCDVTEDSCDSDHEDQLSYGKLLSNLRRTRDRSERQIQKIDADRNAFPERRISAKNVKEAAERVTGLRLLLKEACQSAVTTRSNLEVTMNKVNEIAAAEREVKHFFHRFQRTARSNRLLSMHN